MKRFISKEVTSLRRAMLRRAGRLTGTHISHAARLADDFGLPREVVCRVFGDVVAKLRCYAGANESADLRPIIDSMCMFQELSKSSPLSEATIERFFSQSLRSGLAVDREILAHRQQGLSHTEIAAAMNVDVAEVKSRYLQILVDMSIWLYPTEPDGDGEPLPAEQLIRTQVA